MKSGRQRERQRQREVVVGGEKFSLFRRGGNKISFFCSMSSQMAVLSWRGQATPASFISSSQHCLHLFGCLSIHLRSPSSSSLPLYDVPHKKQKKKKISAFICLIWHNENVRLSRPYLLNQCPLIELWQNASFCFCCWFNFESLRAFDVWKVFKNWHLD